MTIHIARLYSVIAQQSTHYFVVSPICCGRLWGVKESQKNDHDIKLCSHALSQQEKLERRVLSFTFLLQNKSQEINCRLQKSGQSDSVLLSIVQ